MKALNISFSDTLILFCISSALDRQNAFLQTNHELVLKSGFSYLTYLAANHECTTFTDRFVEKTVTSEFGQHPARAVIRVPTRWSTNPIRWRYGLAILVPKRLDFVPKRIRSYMQIVVSCVFLHAMRYNQIYDVFTWRFKSVTRVVTYLRDILVPHMCRVYQVRGIFDGDGSGILALGSSVIARLSGGV